MCSFTALYLLPSIILVCSEITALHLKMPHQLYCCLSNPFEIHWKTAHPQPAPASFSSQRHQCEHYSSGSSGVENGVFLIFCLIQLPYSELAVSLCRPQLNPTIARHHKPCVFLCSHLNSSLILVSPLNTRSQSRNIQLPTQAQELCGSLKCG